jgi:hypothetical protein
MRTFALLAASASALVAPPPASRSSSAIEAAIEKATSSALSSEKFTFGQLEALAKEQNPAIQYFDPMGLATYQDGEGFWGEGTEATIGFLRQAEIKHGRVAMAAFVGFIVHAKGYTWPFAMTLAGDAWPSLAKAGSVPALWDALPGNTRWQILLGIAALEVWDEIRDADDCEPHYMRGGTPGKFRPFGKGMPFQLYDPFGWSNKRSEEKKARGRNVEVNNGRLAMIGLMGFLAESAVPGSVPGLGGVGLAQYTGNVMAPFEGVPNFAACPFLCWDGGFQLP